MHFKRTIQFEYGAKQFVLVPMINILFLLLIFFMFGSSFITQSGMVVDLPRAVTAEAVNGNFVEIVVTDENTVYVEKQAVTGENLNNLLRETAKRNIPVLIKADRKAAMGTVAGISDLCRNAGIRKISLATSNE